MPGDPSLDRRPSSCAVCGANGCEPRLRVRGVDVYRCPDCGLQFWLPPRDFEPRAIYGSGYFERSETQEGYDDYGALEDSLRANFERRLKRLPLPRAGARLLDLGAAFGFGVAEARRAGWVAVGAEISAPAAARAATITGGRIVRADAPRPPFPPATFAAITLWDTLEHLADPHLVIGSAADLLEPDGRLVVTTGDVESWMARLSGERWHLYSIPEHLFFYTRRSLEVLASAHGLRVESIRARASSYPVHYLIERLRKTLTGVAEGTARRWALGRLVLPVNLFDVLTLSAIKEGSGQPADNRP